MVGFDFRRYFAAGLTKWLRHGHDVDGGLVWELVSGRYRGGVEARLPRYDDDTPEQAVSRFVETGELATGARLAESDELPDPSITDSEKREPETDAARWPVLTDPDVFADDVTQTNVLPDDEDGDPAPALAYSPSTLAAWTMDEDYRNGHADISTVRTTIPDILARPDVRGEVTRAFDALDTPGASETDRYDAVWYLNEVITLHVAIASHQARFAPDSITERETDRALTDAATRAHHAMRLAMMARAAHAAALSVEHGHTGAADALAVTPDHLHTILANTLPDIPSPYED